ncbi:MAG: carbonic anhydrase [Xenococcaceae cyanobacterium]
MTLEVSRRKLMKFGAGFLGTGTLASVVGLNLGTPESVVAKNDIAPDRALEQLMEGNNRFISGKPNNSKRDLASLKSVSKEQKPFAAILGCADSRVPSEIIFDRGFGELFIVRCAGNVATPEEIGSLEFGTLVLGAKVLMVMGHAGCGAVKAAMAGAPVPGSIPSVLAQIEPAVKDIKGSPEDSQALKKATEANVLAQVQKLTASPVISELITAGKLKIVGAYFNFETGQISLVS